MVWGDQNCTLSACGITYVVMNEIKLKIHFWDHETIILFCNVSMQVQTERGIRLTFLHVIRFNQRS